MSRRRQTSTLLGAARGPQLVYQAWRPFPLKSRDPLRALPGMTAALLVDMQVLETLAPLALGSVTGGGAPPRRPAPAPAPRSATNRTTVDGNIGVTARGVQVGVQGHVDVQRSDYASCLSTAERMHANPAQTLAMCGRPGGS
jgi:hypothetical protein